MARAKKQQLIVRGDAAGLWLIFLRDGKEINENIFLSESQVIKLINAGTELTLEGKAVRLIDRSNYY